jgi:ArsR family transcriptional regulator, virulence genes transcriptional regulator
MSAKKISIPRLEKRCGEVTQLLRALSHPQRLLIMGYLIQGEKTVTDLQDLCGISQSQLSQFLTRMKSEGLISCQRRGRYQYYQAADHRVTKLIATIENLYCC